MSASEYRDALLEKLTRLIEELQRITQLFILAKYSLANITQIDSETFMHSYAKITKELKENQGTFFKNFQASINGINIRIANTKNSYK